MLRPFRILFFVCAASALASTPEDTARSLATATLHNLPLRFEENRGQWNTDVRYVARAGSYTVLLTGRGPSIAVAGSRRMDIDLVNANAKARIEPVDRLTTRTDYFLGGRQNWRTGVANYARVRYSAVYPGIDLVYYGNRNELEYDFVLAPGADPNAIRLRFKGQVGLHLTADGELALDVAGERIVQRKPFVYQDSAGGTRRSAIGARYVLVGKNSVAIQVDAYDRTRPLVIDPVLSYCTYIGGDGTDVVTAVKMGPNGRLYIGGYTTTSQIPYIDGAYNNKSAGGTDLFVSIVDTTQPNLPVVYMSYLGGTKNDLLRGMDVDSSGVVYLAGTTLSLDFPMAGASVRTTNAGTYETGFVAKLDPSQYGGVSLLYTSYIGGTTANDACESIAAGPDGTIYVMGTAASSDVIVTSNAFQGVRWGSQDTFLMKIDPANATPVYSTYLGGEREDAAQAILVGPDGLVYFALNTNSTLFPIANFPYNGVLQGPMDGVVGVLDMTKEKDASLLWTTYLGGTDTDEVRGIALDPKGRVVVTGYTLSNDFPVTANAFRGFYAGNTDAFVAVLDRTRADFITYSTYLGGSQGDGTEAVALDGEGNIYVTGYSLSSDFPTTPDAVQHAWGGGADLILTKLTPNGTGDSSILTSTYIGDAGMFVGTTLAVGSDGTAYIGGYGTMGLPSSANASQGGFAGGYVDGFLISVRK